MINNDLVLSLIKIGDEKHQKSLFQKGEIYMNTQQYFRKLEDHVGRGDKYEGADKIEQVNWIKLSDGKNEFEFSIEAGNLNRANVISRFEEFNCNIFSMIGISGLDINKKQPVKGSNENLGDFFILIHNVKEFNKRMKNKLDSMNYEHRWGWVRYYKEYEYEGELTLLDKPISFQDQKEVRYIVHSGKNEPIKFEVGSLADIAVPFRIEELKTLILDDEEVIQIGNTMTNKR